jgi:hypothetical protein
MILQALNIFKTELQPWMDEQELSYTAMQFERQGYHRLHIYNNKLAEHTDARWLMIWNDDAVMETQGWDTEIMNYEGQFKLLAFPYSFGSSLQHLSYLASQVV